MPKALTLDEARKLAEAPRPSNPRPLSPPRIFAYVDAVARHGSIRKAASALHIVSSALNRRILDLEEELGSPLFERLPRGVRPTAAGELYLAYVRRSIRELEHVGAQIEGLRRLLRGRVRLAVAESVTGHMLPTAIARFQAQHPNVQFHVWIDGPKGLSDALATDAADLILTHDPPERPQVSVIASVHQPLCALVALQARAGARLEFGGAHEDVREAKPGGVLSIPDRRQSGLLGHGHDSADRSGLCAGHAGSRDASPSCVAGRLGGLCVADGRGLRDPLIGA